MEKVYDPKATEAKWYRYWEENGLFHAEPDSALPGQAGKKPYTIVIPPPNVTGILTMGHVLNNTLQDILIRWKKMQGYESLWVPGTDHAGIATQNVVEEVLAEKGKSRHELGRERFLQKVWEWKEKHGSIIIEQLKMLGCSCDWERERFTMDEGLSRAVQEAFVRLYQKGLIYRGRYIINWCPRCQTALSDEESIHREEEGSLWYIRYPIKGEDGDITVATTRPETMLGDTAVAVNPEDRRYIHLVGKTLILPILGREIPVIADDFADPEFGTGAVKVTPAHDPNDFEIGQRHNLPQVIVMNEDATMNDNAGPRYTGMDRYQCRELLLKDLKALGLLAKAERYTYSIGYCQRCGTTLEPYLSDQWFLRMKPLADPAIEAVKKGQLRFCPEHWTKTYLHWLENIRDWCISRQLWWGHRIPVWYCECGYQIVERETPARCPQCGSEGLTQDEDVLDTWFSSWLWPFSTMGWPEQTPELEVFYPTDTLVTAPDIIFFWVAKMVMAGYEFMGECPFKDVYFNSMVLDAQGRKMSKSLGNSPDPTLVMDEYGADALRFTMTMLSPQGQDVYYSDEKVEIGRNFCNKIWNAARFVLTNLSDEIDRTAPELPLSRDRFELSDRWILSRLGRVTSSVTDSLGKYRFSEAAHCIYDFFWHEYCDWYLELVKPRLYRPRSRQQKEAAQQVMAAVLGRAMQLLHPFMPFITEEIWQRLNKPREISSQSISQGKDGRSVMVSEWPEANLLVLDEGAEREISLIQEVIVTIRNIRAETNIHPSKEVNAVLRSSSDELLEILQNNSDYIRDLAKVRDFSVGADIERPRHCATAVVRGTEIFVPLEGLIDLSKERERLDRETKRISGRLIELSNKLKDKNFLEKAPPEVVERERQKEGKCRKDLEKLKKNLEALV